jgi:hypothetical protein
MNIEAVASPLQIAILISFLIMLFYNIDIKGE